MPKHSRKKHSRKGNAHARPVVPGAPNLHKESVTLTGIQFLAGGSNGGTTYALVNGNGCASPGVPATVPQAALWNQYAAMYEFYQVKGIRAKFVPYRFQGHGAQDQITVFNNYSIIQPDDVVALVNGAVDREALFSYGNCQIHQGYDTNHRQIKDYTNLCISKQNEIILKTGGGTANKQDYKFPATLGFYIFANDFGTRTQGEIVYSIDYVFSGMKRPDVQLPQLNFQTEEKVSQPQAQAPPVPRPEPMSNPQFRAAQLRAQAALLEQTE